MPRRQRGEPVIDPGGQFDRRLFSGADERAERCAQHFHVHTGAGHRVQLRVDVREHRAGARHRGAVSARRLGGQPRRIVVVAVEIDQQRLRFVCHATLLLLMQNPAITSPQTGDAGRRRSP